MRYSLQGIAFEWDARKADANRGKHGVDFELACEAFFDPFLRVLDAGSEGGEMRQAIVGLTTHWQFLYVVFVERDEVLRIISARPATPAERRFYEDP
jgi:uncharacterized DUF497 family protein